MYEHMHTQCACPPTHTHKQLHSIHSSVQNWESCRRLAHFLDPDRTADWGKSEWETDADDWQEDHWRCATYLCETDPYSRTENTTVYDRIQALWIFRTGLQGGLMAHIKLVMGDPTVPIELRALRPSQLIAISRCNIDESGVAHSY